MELFLKCIDLSLSIGPVQDVGTAIARKGRTGQGSGSAQDSAFATVERECRTA